MYRTLVTIVVVGLVAWPAAAEAQNRERQAILQYFARNRMEVQALPPGIARNLQRGKPLPRGIAKRALPQGLQSTLPAREGLEVSILGDRVVLLQASGLVVDILEGEGYRVSVSENGEEALQSFHLETPDLAILDIMMPRLSGYDVCREIRKADAKLPILMLSAKSEEIDKVLGLELGADDYITKPFGVRELLARVHAAFRRASATTSAPTDESPVRFGDVELDRARRQLLKGGSELALTQLEYKLLEAFVEHADRALSRDELLNAAWGIDYQGTTRTLDQHVSQLRHKIEPDPAKPRFILTVHGYGYRYCPAT